MADKESSKPKVKKEIDQNKYDDYTDYLEAKRKATKK